MCTKLLRILLVSLLLIIPVIVQGQGMGNAEPRAEQQTRKTPAMRERVYNRIPVRLPRTG